MFLCYVALFPCGVQSLFKDCVMKVAAGGFSSSTSFSVALTGEQKKDPLHVRLGFTNKTHNSKGRSSVTDSSSRGARFISKHAAHACCCSLDAFLQFALQ